MSIKIGTKKLQRETSVWILLGIMFLAGIAFLLANAWEPRYAVRWLPLPVITLMVLSCVVWRNLNSNHRRGETELLPDLGWGNRLTLLRGLLVGGMLGFILLPQPLGWLGWIPAVLYTLADAADFFDGYVARVTNHATQLGEILDMSFDGLGVMAATVLAVQYGKVPVWYLGIGSARYLFLVGIWLLRRLDRPVYDLPPRLSRRVFAGLQMGFLAGVLWPIFVPPGTMIAAALFGFPMIYGFSRDWLFVSGVIQPGALETRRLSQIVARWLPVGMRGVILALNIAGITAWLQNFASLDPAVAGLGLLNLLTVSLLLLGITPRLASIAGLCVLGLYQLISPLTPTQIILAAAYTLILYMGSGAWSVWTPEDSLYVSHAGARITAESDSMELGQGA